MVSVIKDKKKGENLSLSPLLINIQSQLDFFNAVNKMLIIYKKKNYLTNSIKIGFSINFKNSLSFLAIALKDGSPSNTIFN